MLGRLGQVIYWLGCIFAVLWVVLGVWGANGIRGPVPTSYIIALIGPAVLAWAVGWAIRYVLGGR